MNKRFVFLIGVLSIAGFLMALPYPVLADFGSLPWETPLQVLTNALNGSTGTLMATLAIMVVGVLALMGRISWGHAGAVLFGIVCIFGASRIVAIFHG